jgi:hypothetical protein
VKSPQSVGNGNDRRPVLPDQIRHVIRELPHQESGCSRSGGLAQEPMTVCPIPRKGDEKLPRPNLPRIDRGSPHGPVGRVDQPTAG